MSKPEIQNENTVAEVHPVKDPEVPPVKKAKEEEDVYSTERRIAAQMKAAKKVKIRIPSQGREAGTASVPVGVNGEHFLIKRDTEVVVPIGVYNALMDAQEEFCEAYDENGQKKVRFRKTLRYPVVYLGEVNES